MKRIYDFGRRPAMRNYTIADLQALKGSGKKLSMSNPSNPEELQACLDANIDLLVIWDEHLEYTREVAPHFLQASGAHGHSSAQPRRSWTTPLT